MYVTKELKNRDVLKGQHDDVEAVKFLWFHNL